MRHSHGGFQIPGTKRSSAVCSDVKANRVNACVRRPRVALLLVALSAMTLCFQLLGGCSHNTNGPTAPSLLQGNPAFHASAVAEYQSLGAGVSYPYAGLRLAAPTGSPIHSRSVVLPLPLLQRSMALNRASHLTDTLTFVPALNLYTDGGKFTGNVATVSFYSDAAATQSAGSFTIKLATNLTNPSDPTSYASYPAIDTIVVNLTGGNLLCQGNVLLTFTGGTGANSMTGTLTLTKDNVVFNLNLGLSDQLDVSGSITITESGATLQVTNVQGKITDTLSCNVKASPYGWTGTGTLSLLTGSMTVNLNTGTGSSTAASDLLGNLNIKYADGTQETVTNALSGGLTGNNTGGGPNGSYNAPLIFTSNQRTIVTINNKGQSVGYLGAAGLPIYWATPTAQAETLHIPAGDTYDQLTGLNDNGQIVGFGYGADYRQTSPLYWSSPTAQPQKLAMPANATSAFAEGINNRGQIVGWADTSIGLDVYFVGLYWSTPTAQPQVLQPLAGRTGVTTTFIAPNSQIIGTARGSNGALPVFWAGPTAQPVALNVLTGDNYSTPMSVNAAGLIVGASDFQNGTPHAVTWTGAGAPAQALPQLPGTVEEGNATSINTAGAIVGFLAGSIPNGSSFDVGVIWKSGQVQDLNTLIPSGNSWTLLSASLITDQGWILGTAYSPQNSTTAQFLIIPK